MAKYGINFHLYQNYVHGFTYTYGTSLPLLAFYESLDKGLQGSTRNQLREPKFQDSSCLRMDNNSSVSSATSATSLGGTSPGNSKKPNKNRWIKRQMEMLVSLWKENIGVSDSTGS